MQQHPFWQRHAFGATHLPPQAATALVATSRCSRNGTSSLVAGASSPVAGTSNSGAGTSNLIAGTPSPVKLMEPFTSLVQLRCATKRMSPSCQMGVPCLPQLDSIIFLLSHDNCFNNTTVSFAACSLSKCGWQHLMMSLRLK